MRDELLAELYGKYYHRAYLYALSLCREKSWAEDIVSEAFEKAMLTLEDGGQGFLYWLLRVCRNLFLDEARRRKRRPAEEWQETIGAVPEDALAAVLKKEENQRLYRAVEALTAQYRELLTLFYFGGVSLKEAAEFMGLPYGAAKTALCRARVRLKKELEADGYDI